MVLSGRVASWARRSGVARPVSRALLVAVPSALGEPANPERLDRTGFPVWILRRWRASQGVGDALRSKRG